MARKSKAEIALAADTSDTEWITMKEAALLIRVDPVTIRRWITAGYIRAERFGPRLIRVDKATLVASGETLVWERSVAS